MTAFWHGIEEFNASLDAKMERTATATREGVIEAAHVAEGHMKLRAGEGGRHAQGTPTPASLGGGPAVISGALRASIGVGDEQSFGASGFSAKVGPRVIYGRRVELEYDYPYTSTGLADSLGEIASVFQKVFAKANA